MKKITCYLIVVTLLLVGSSSAGAKNNNQANINDSDSTIFFTCTPYPDED
ncbi:MAG: hypothetical protein KAX49_18595 [Halanaerobiales bacterium]|nr:hypothetical protein [Halanaerobiales bacterium]